MESLETEKKLASFLTLKDTSILDRDRGYNACIRSICSMVVKRGDEQRQRSKVRKK